MSGQREHRANCKVSRLEDGQIVRTCAPDCPLRPAITATGTITAEVHPDALAAYLTAMCEPVVRLLGLGPPDACPACGAPPGVACRPSCETNRAR